MELAEYLHFASTKGHGKKKTTPWRQTKEGKEFIQV